MNKQGKLYAYGSAVILRTGPGNSEKSFSGVIVEQKDQFSDFQVGHYSNTWSEFVFTEYENHVVLDNMRWKEKVEIGNSPG